MTEEKKKSNPISRREFIRDAGLVVGGAVVGAGITYPLVPEIAQAAQAGVYEVLPPYGKPTITVWDPPETTIVFTGTFEEVLKHYREKMWSDGLPIVPPTVEKVKEFLKYTDYPADAELTRPLPPCLLYTSPSPRD